MRSVGVPGCAVAGAVGALLLAAGCATAVQSRHGGRVPGQGWALLPLQNHSEAPQADERVRALLSTMLRARGVKDLRETPRAPRPDPVPELDARRRAEGALAWAREAGLAVGITGSVNEWRYRGSPEGYPAVGITLTVLEVESGKVLWTASGALSGGGSDAASGVAQRLLGSMLEGMELQ